MQQYKRIASAFVLAVFLATLAVPPAGAVSLSSWKNKLSRTINSINNIKNNLHRVKENQKNYAKQLAASEQKLRLNRAHLRDIQTQLRNTRYRLATTRSEIVRLENRLSERNELLAARMADTYKHGNISYASILLGSADFWDLLSRAYVVKKVLQSDVDLIEGIKQDKQAVEQYKGVLEDQEQERARLESRQSAATHSVQTQTNIRANLLGKANAERKYYEQKFAELDRNSNQIEAMIRKMERQSGKGGKQYYPVWKGGFLRPVSGAVTSSYGMRFHPILRRNKLHTGVDLKASYGTPIKAAAGGIVWYAGWYGAYGNAVIISHGGDTTTLYGHCSSIMVGTGATVKQGQVIARAGSTGFSTGAHLHFEVRKHGVPVCPPF